MFRYFQKLFFILIYFIFVIKISNADDNIFKKVNIEILNIKIFNEKNEPVETLRIFEKKNNYLINFWATWCQPCKKELPDLEKIYNDLKIINLKILIISIDKKSIKKQKLFLKQRNVNQLIPYFDPDMKLFNSLKLRGIPTSILIKKNKIIAKKEGIIEHNENMKKELIRYFN